MDSVLEKTLDKAWNSTCRVLFGREIGPLEKYRDWLGVHLPKPARRKSRLSGKEVILAMDSYSRNARFLSEKEVVQNRNYALNINEIKDIDSIAEALAGKCEYVGNRFLGNSAYVEESDIVIDSQYVNNSTNIEESMYVDSSFMIRKGSKYIFGSGYMGVSEFIVRVVGTFNSKRCFESYFVPDSSDIFFSESCFGCRELMFCFGQRSTSYRIGNLALPKDNYRQLKAKLLSEVASELEKEGRFPTLLEMAGESAETAGKLEVEEEKLEQSMAPMEKGFASACNVVLKRNIGSIRQYEGWLSQNTGELLPLKTPFGRVVQCPKDFAYVPSVPKGRMVNFAEMIALGKKSLAENEIQTLGGIRKAIGKIGYFTLELFDGENLNYIDSPLVYHGTNIYKTYDVTHGENTGVCFLALNSKYVYGSYRILESQFSLKCYNSLYLNRCFELDSCSKCSDSYFCHNSEALQDCMFCFNMKGRRHFIGNTDVGKEKYAQVKGTVLAQIGEELEKKKSLKWNIFNIGAR
ncbi:MAG: hypothetical protein QW568_01840 [Candidatus Anstonellaceae archaeon]